MIKTFILDTNIILLDPQCIFKFGKNFVHIPLVCIEELDRFKKDQNENGRNARYFARIVDGLRQQGPLFKGIELSNGGTLVITDHRDSFKEDLGLVVDKSDNYILGTALALKKKNENVVLVTKDINLRLKADVLGITAEDYGRKTDQNQDQQLYSGHTNLEVESKQLEDFLKRGFLAIDKNVHTELMPNQYVTLFSREDKECKMYGRYSIQSGGIVPLKTFKEGVWGIYPKNVEQQFAFDALMNDEIKMVTLVGKAGTGKTLVAIASALEKTIEQGEYIRLLVSRPIQPMGKDLGFLPGDVEEKLGPWMLPIFDALDFLFSKQKSREEGPAAWNSLKEKGLLQVEPLTYIRGRSIPSQFFVIDEAQNLSPHEVKTIVTRVAEGSKIILSGDTEQIDNPYLDSVNNGLSYAIERLKGESIVAHISLQDGERSDLSEIASKLL